jgi:hypothetical protein
MIKNQSYVLAEKNQPEAVLKQIGQFFC